MKISAPDWNVIKRPLLVLLAALAIGAALVYWTHQRAAEARQGYAREQTALDQMRGRLARVDEEQRIILRYAPAYQRLLEQGIVGAEQRANWLDALRAASQAMHGFGVDYQVSGQQAALFKIDAGTHEVQQSAMKLRMRLLHEGDLLTFLSALDAQQAGLPLLQDCIIQRLATGPFTARFEPKLSADCTVAWVTLGDKSAKEAH